MKRWKREAKAASEYIEILLSRKDDLLSDLRHVTLLVKEREDEIVRLEKINERLQLAVDFYRQERDEIVDILCKPTAEDLEGSDDVGAAIEAHLYDGPDDDDDDDTVSEGLNRLFSEPPVWTQHRDGCDCGKCIGKPRWGHESVGRRP